MNYVGDEDGGIAEIQICGEKRTISDDEFTRLLALCKGGVTRLIELQKEVIRQA